MMSDVGTYMLLDEDTASLLGEGKTVDDAVLDVFKRLSKGEA